MSTAEKTVDESETYEFTKDIELTPPTVSTQDEQAVPPLSDVAVTNNIVNRLRRLTTRVHQANRWAERALDTANASATTPLPPLNVISSTAERRQYDPPVENRKENQPFKTDIYTYISATPPRLPPDENTYISADNNTTSHEMQNVPPPMPNIPCPALIQSDGKRFLEMNSSLHQQSSHHELVDTFRPTNKNPPSRESSDASYLTPNWGNNSRFRPKQTNLRVGQQQQFDNVLQASQMKNSTTAGLVACNKSLEHLLPFLDTLEMEPYLRMATLITNGRGTQLHKLAIFLRSKIMQRWQESYRVSGQREIAINEDKSISFKFRSKVNVELDIEKKFKVLDGGKVIEILNCDNDSLLERYVIGTDAIPKKHILRYKYLRDALKPIRGSIPRALVCYGHSGLAATLGSCRFPGVNVELFMCPKSIVGEEDGHKASESAVPLDSYLVRAASVVRLWSILITAPEESESKEPGAIEDISLPVYYPSSVQDSTSSESTDTYITTPSPLYMGAKALYRQWENSSKRGSTRRLATPYHSAFTRPSSAGGNTYLQSFLERWPLTPKISACRLHLVLEQTDHLATHDIQFDESKTLTVIFSLSEALLWDTLDQQFGQANQVPKCHAKSSYYKPNKNDDEWVKCLIDNGSLYWALNCSLNILSSNLELLSNLTDRDSVAIDTFHKTISERAKNGPVDGAQLRHVYSQTFPIVSVLMPNTSSPSRSPSASYTDDDQDDYKLGG